MSNIYKPRQFLKVRDKNDEECKCHHYSVHTLNWVGAEGGGVYFWKISGGYLIFEFYCIFMH